MIQQAVSGRISEVSGCSKRLLVFGVVDRRGSDEVKELGAGY